MTSRPEGARFGNQLRRWRISRGMSQLSLATRVETTTRHLSFLENGKSRPGRELVLRLGDALELPLRVRNDWLVSAGLAPEFPSRKLGDPVLEPYRAAISQVIEALRPFPAFVVDATFGLLDANGIGRRLLPSAVPDNVNLVDAFLGPGMAREVIVNFPEVAWAWHDRLMRATASMKSDAVLALHRRVVGYLEGVRRPLSDATGPPVLCPTLRVGGTTVRTIGMTMSFGPSRDVTLEELSVDVLCPRDEEARRFFEEMENTRG